MGRVNSWSESENAILEEYGALATAKQLMRRLPGRSATAIIHQRSKLGVKSPAHGSAFSPHAVGGRLLLAKSCTKCGLLLEGTLFRIADGYRRDSWCRFCRSAIESKRNGGRISKQYKNSAYAAQAATLENATRHGMPYTEKDFRVMDDSTLTQLEKALKLGRTYLAVSQMCRKNGYLSRGVRSLGEASSAAWAIDNPNASRVDEITGLLEANPGGYSYAE